MNAIKPYVELMRIRHWVKNLLVLVPLAFSGEMTDLYLLVWGGVAALSFCLMSSAVYINNDLADAEADRRHPIKCDRPIASGRAKPEPAVVLAIALALSSLALAYVCGGEGCVVLLTLYGTLNVAYSRGLKDRPVADVAVLASGFVLRVLFGGAACGVPVSLWLYLTVLSFALYLALSKRAGELRACGVGARRSLGSYPPEFLSQGATASLAMGLIFYSLWSCERVDPVASAELPGALLVVAGVPLAVLLCLRYGYVASRPGADADPVRTLLADGWLAALVVLWAAVVLASIYLPGLL